MKNDRHDDGHTESEDTDSKNIEARLDYRIVLEASLDLAVLDTGVASHDEVGETQPAREGNHEVLSPLWEVLCLQLSRQEYRGRSEDNRGVTKSGVDVFEDRPQLCILARSEVSYNGLKESNDKDCEPNDGVVFLISNRSQSFLHQDRNEPGQTEYDSQHHGALVEAEPNIRIVKLLSLQKYFNVFSTIKGGRAELTVNVKVPCTVFCVFSSLTMNMSLQYLAQKVPVMKMIVLTHLRQN